MHDDQIQSRSGHAGFQEHNASLGSGELQNLAGGNFEVTSSPDSQGSTTKPYRTPLLCLLPWGNLGQQ